MKRYIFSVLLSAMLAFSIFAPQISQAEENDQYELILQAAITTCMSQTGAVEQIITFRDMGKTKEEVTNAFLKSVETYNKQAKSRNLPRIESPQIIEAVVVISWVYDNGTIGMKELLENYYVDCVSIELERYGIVVTPKSEEIEENEE